MVLGGDGYLGWAVSMYLARKWHDVLIVDNFIKRKWELQFGVKPLIPTKTLHERLEIFKNMTGQEIYLRVGSLLNHRFIYTVFDEFRPEVVIHCANQPSAVFSMKDRATATETMQNNVIGNLNLLFAIQHSRCDPHLITVGSLTGNSQATTSSGTADSKHGPSDSGKADSFFQLSRNHQSQDIRFASQVWGLRATELNFGVIYGMDTEEIKMNDDVAPSFYYDEMFGTVVHRFCAQAISLTPMTVYGKGTQTRGFIHLSDAVKSLEKAMMQEPEKGEVKTLNKFAEIQSIKDVAQIVQKNAAKFGKDALIRFDINPRIELENDYYTPTDNSHLDDSITPLFLEQGALEYTLEKILEYQNNINPNLFKMNIFWHWDTKDKWGYPSNTTGHIEGSLGNNRETNFTGTKKVRKICFSTGKRGGFGALMPLLKMISEADDMELQLIVTDMHLYETFGKTANEVANYFKISRLVEMAQTSDTNWNRTRSLGRCLMGMAQALKDLEPDIVLLLGDRSETLATAFSAIEMGIPVAHVQAGDVSGGLDDLHRHSITKLAHLHFSQTEKQGKRVLALGEEPWRVFVSGAPYVDRIVSGDYTQDAKLLSGKMGLNVEEPFFIILQHSDTYYPHESYQQMKNIITAVSQTKIPSIICYPCTDQGYQGVIDAIQEVRGNPQFHIFYSIDSFDFLGLQAYARLLIGNSSAGIIEAPYFQLPFVNVGYRQYLREKGANVIDAGTTVKTITHAIEQGLNENFRQKLHNIPPLFGDGKANERIFNVLKDVEIDAKLFRKRVIAEV